MIDKIANNISGHCYNCGRNCFSEEEIELVQDIKEVGIIKAIDKDINILKNAILKHNNKIDKIKKQIKKLEEKKEKHIIEAQTKSVKKMTVSEICKKLGYDVEIIKER